MSAFHNTARSPDTDEETVVFSCSSVCECILHKMDLDIDVEMLISLVEQRPCLWDRTTEIYKDKNATVSAWKEICAIIKEDYDFLNEKEKNEIGKFVIKKWANIRDNWMKWNKKYNEQKKSGVRTNTLRKYIYYDQMRFLEKIAAHRPTEPSLDEEETASSFEQRKTELQSVIGNKRKRNPDEVEPNKRKPSTSDYDYDRHLSFFKGILPSIKDFEDDQTIEFQMGVLLLIRNIKTRYPGNPPNVPLHPHTCNAES